MSLCVYFRRIRALFSCTKRAISDLRSCLGCLDLVIAPSVKPVLLGEPVTVYGDGSHTRSFGFYEDILDGAWRLAQSDFHEPVNIGTEEERTVLEFAKLVIEITGSKSQIVHQDAAIDDPKQRKPDL